MGFIWYIIIGIVAGFLAGKIMRRRFWSCYKFITWYSWRCTGRLGVCPFRTGSFRTDRKFDNFHRRSYPCIVDCFFILEI